MWSSVAFAVNSKGGAVEGVVARLLETMVRLEGLDGQDGVRWRDLVSLGVGVISGYHCVHALIHVTARDSPGSFSYHPRGCPMRASSSPMVVGVKLPDR